MAEIWMDWGGFAYAIAALWAFFEGETFVLVAAALGRTQGLVNPWVLMLSVWLGSFLGDQLWFALGRRFGMRVVQRFPSGEKRLGTALRMIEKYGTLFILSFRLIYGIRNIASVACGLSNIPRLKFAILNFIAAGIWAASFVAAGWFVGEAIAKHGFFLVGGILLGLIAAFFVGRAIWQRCRAAPVSDTAIGN